MTLLILTATRGSDEEQVLVTQDDFDDAGGKAADFFLKGAKNARVEGRLECEGDTEFISGSYTRD